MHRRQIAIVFPGQGVLDTTAFERYDASLPDLASVLSDVDHTARPYGRTALVDALGELGRPGLGTDLLIYAASIAGHERLARGGAAPYALVGHGFGEIAALVAAGAFSIAEGAEIVVQRFLSLGARATRRNAMAAIHASPAQARALVRLLENDGLSIAAENSSRESVIVGPGPAIEAAAKIARLLGIRLRRLKTSAGPHHPFTDGIKAEMVDRLAHIPCRPMRTPVFSPLHGRFFRNSDDLIDALAQQLVEPLRFADAVRQLVDEGVTLLVECGPLRGLAAKLDCAAITDAQIDREWHGAGESECTEPADTVAERGVA